ncbi:MAG: lysylphosphatidylglycerol synthase transmembrane domain-containing protein [Sedimentisphaerales bacterium]|jgi:uncharacterized protein (TIRG00374 family)
MFSFLRKLWLRPLTRVLISISILFVLLTTLPLHNLWQTVSRIPVGLWMLAVMTTIFVHFVGVVKWSLLINMTNRTLPLLSACRCYFAGLFANIFLPSINGGDIVRAGLAISLNHEKEAVILGSLTDRLLDASALALIVFTGTLLLPNMRSIGTHKILIGTLIVLFSFVSCCVILFVIPLSRKIPNLVSNSIIRLRYVMMQFVRRPWRVLAGLCAAIIVQMWFVLLFSILGGELGIYLPLSVWLIVWPTAKLSAMLPISLGGLGVREAALAILLGQFNVSITSSVGLGLLWESLFLAVGGFGGIFYFSSKRSCAMSRQAIESRATA